MSTFKVKFGLKWMVSTGTLHYIYEWTEINNLTAPQWLFFFSSFSPSDSQGPRLDFLPTKSLGHGATNHYTDRQANICTSQQQANTTWYAGNERTSAFPELG